MKTLNDVNESVRCFVKDSVGDSVWAFVKFSSLNKVKEISE